MRLKVTFAVLNLCNTHNLGNVVCFNSLCLYITWKAPAASDLNIVIKGERLLKVTHSHVYWKNDNIMETVRDRDVVTSGH